MPLSDSAVEEFRAIYKQKYGEEISTAKAREMGERLLTLFSLLKQPYPGEHGPDAIAPAQTPPTAS